MRCGGFRNGRCKFRVGENSALNSSRAVRFAPKGIESSLVSETTKDLPEDALVASQIGEAGQFVQPMLIGNTVSVIGVE
jgi:hypothetical protein